MGKSIKVGEFIFDLESLPMGKVWEHVVVVVLFEKRT